MLETLCLIHASKVQLTILKGIDLAMRIYTNTVNTQLHATLDLASDLLLGDTKA